MCKTRYIFINEFGDVKEYILSANCGPRGMKIEGLRPVKVYVVGELNQEILYKNLNYALHPTKRQGVVHFEDYAEYAKTPLEELQLWEILDGRTYNL